MSDFMNLVMITRKRVKFFDSDPFQMGECIIAPSSSGGVAGGAAAGETLDDTTERELQDDVAEREFEDALLDFDPDALNLPEDVILDIDHMRLVVMILQMK